MTTSLFDIAINTLEKEQTALTAEEIWDRSEALGTRRGFESKGKTPAATLGAVIYRDIGNNGDQSPFRQVSKSPAKFCLQQYKDNFTEPAEGDIKVESAPIVRQESNFDERDLHPLLVYFVQGHQHFRARTKTIYHEGSERKPKGMNEWLHPDLVSVRFPFDDYVKGVIETQEKMAANSVRLYSFEMKKELNMGNLRASYFQAVSNSSWAHEGYLVALDIDWENVREECRRLNKAFGIGIIRLNADADVDESEILFPSRIEETIDWDTVDKLARANPDFLKFLELIKEDSGLGKVRHAEYDPVLTEEAMAEYVQKMKIGAAQNI